MPTLCKYITCLPLQEEISYAIFFTVMNYIRFQQLYCDQHSLSPERYFKHLRSRALYPHARFLPPILTLFDADY